MPTTRQNVSWIKDRNPKYSPEQILSILDEVHYRIRSLNIDYNYYLDSTTGMPPFLATIDGVYSYDCPDNCRKTSHIFCWRENNSYPGKSYYGSGRHFRQDNSEIFNWRGREFLSLNYTQQQDKTLRQNAKVIFGSEYNPGTTTDKYYHLYWVVPARIEDVEDELEIPEEFSFEIREAVSAILSTEDYGETGFDDSVLAKAALRISNGLSAGSMRRPTNPTWKREYRDF